MYLLKFKNLFTPKKLWILRLYVALLTYLVEILLVIYVVLSLYNLLAQDNAFGDLILGYAGLYLVWICLAILFVAQVVSLFLNIHDNIEDVRNKAIDPEFSIDVASEKEKNKESSISSVVMITTIILAIILSFVNLNRNNNSNLSYTNTIKEESSEFCFTSKKIKDLPFWFRVTRGYFPYKQEHTSINETEVIGGYILGEGYVFFINNKEIRFSESLATFTKENNINKGVLIAEKYSLQLTWEDDEIDNDGYVEGEITLSINNSTICNSSVFFSTKQ